MTVERGTNELGRGRGDGEWWWESFQKADAAYIELAAAGFEPVMSVVNNSMMDLKRLYRNSRNE